MDSPINIHPISFITLMSLMSLVFAGIVISIRTVRKKHFRQVLLLSGISVLTVLFSSASGTWLTGMHAMLADVSMMFIMIALMVFVLAHIALSEISGQ